MIEPTHEWGELFARDIAHDLTGNLFALRERCEFQLPIERFEIHHSLAVRIVADLGLGPRARHDSHLIDEAVEHRTGARGIVGAERDTARAARTERAAATRLELLYAVHVHLQHAGF